MRVGIAHHFGWAVAVTATSKHVVIDRRRLSLIEPEFPAAPIHHLGGSHAMHDAGERLDDKALASLVAAVRASVTKTTSKSLDELASIVSSPITSLALRKWPLDFPDDIATLRRPPYESRADSVMYCQILAELAKRRGWKLTTYDPKSVESDAAELLGPRSKEVLYGPRTLLGPPWSKDHRMALAATIVSS